MTRRLALYSDQTPPITDAIDERVLRWLSDGAKIGYLPSSPDPERSWFAAQQRYYGRHGLGLEYFGVEEEFDEARIPELLACDAIHLTGGNTYQFLHWLRRRNLVSALREFADKGGVLIGVSAGAILMTRDIDTSMICGDTLYNGYEDTTGLLLVDFAFLPHFDGSFEMREGVSGFARRSRGRVCAVPDGAGIIVDGDSIEPFGPIEWL